ncbi:hypothetical protein D7Y27_03090 [Corallococcus sp. AB004]|nr:hypothetical protein [Corallococcus exiguus]RKI49410.1 hypothetical protein D7Y27_03090 [Corallococcus sp. AB004]
MGGRREDVQEPLRRQAPGRHGAPAPLPVPDALQLREVAWQVLLREDTLAAIQEAGLKGIIPVWAELRNRRTKELPQYELEARPLAKLHPACIQDRDRVPTCDGCGSHGFYLPPERWLLGESIPKDFDLFGVKETTRIVVSERFVDTVNRLGPSDMVYREISVE